MLRRRMPYQGYAVRALDGDAGRLEFCLFDDETWLVRYLVVDTGSWLFGRRVVLEPSAVERVDWPGKRLVVTLTKAEVKESPHANTQKPVSRQRGDPLFVSHRISPIVTGAALWAPGIYSTGASYVGPEPDEMCDPHLRSTDEVCGYRIEAIDGVVGRVAGFGVDDATWTIQFVVVDLGTWWPRKRVLVESRRVDHISWDDRSVLVRLPKHVIEGAPAHGASARVTADYRMRVAQYFDDATNWSAPDVNRR